jgi:hypothetical protein
MRNAASGEQRTVIDLKKLPTCPNLQPKNPIFWDCMNEQESSHVKPAWKGRLIRFLIYLLVGFLCAFLYKQFKN